MEKKKILKMWEHRAVNIGMLPYCKPSVPCFLGPGRVGRLAPVGNKEMHYPIILEYEVPSIAKTTQNKPKKSVKSCFLFSIVATMQQNDDVCTRVNWLERYEGRPVQVMGGGMIVLQQVTKQVSQKNGGHHQQHGVFPYYYSEFKLILLR